MLRFVEKTRNSHRQNAPSEDRSVGSALGGIEARRPPLPGARWPSRRLPEVEGAPPFWRPGSIVGPQRPPGTCSPAPRPTPGPAGSGRAQTLRRWLLPDTDSRTGKTERSPISTSTPFLSVWHQTGRSLRKNPSVFPRSPPLDRRPFFRGRRRSTPVAPRNSQTPVRRPSQVTGVRPENGCSNSKAAAPDLAKGKTWEVAV